jgi:hypothetical protein
MYKYWDSYKAHSGRASNYSASPIMRLVYFGMYRKNVREGAGRGAVKAELKYGTKEVLLRWEYV